MPFWKTWIGGSRSDCCSVKTPVEAICVKCFNKKCLLLRKIIGHLEEACMSFSAVRKPGLFNSVGEFICI